LQLEQFMTRNIASPSVTALEGTGAVYLGGVALMALALALLAHVTCIRDGNVEFRPPAPAPTTVSHGETHLRVHRVLWW
jgi:hypothetical protein